MGPGRKKAGGLTISVVSDMLQTLLMTFTFWSPLKHDSWSRWEMGLQGPHTGAAGQGLALEQI